MTTTKRTSAQCPPGKQRAAIRRCFAQGKGDGGGRNWGNLSSPSDSSSQEVVNSPANKETVEKNRQKFVRKNWFEWRFNVFCSLVALLLLNGKFYLQKVHGQITLTFYWAWKILQISLRLFQAYRPQEIAPDEKYFALLLIKLKPNFQKKNVLPTKYNKVYVVPWSPNRINSNWY